MKFFKIIQFLNELFFRFSWKIVFWDFDLPGSNQFNLYFDDVLLKNFKTGDLEKVDNLSTIFSIFFEHCWQIPHFTSSSQFLIKFRFLLQNPWNVITFKMSICPFHTTRFNKIFIASVTSKLYLRINPRRPSSKGNKQNFEYSGGLESSLFKCTNHNMPSVWTMCKGKVKDTYLVFCFCRLLIHYGWFERCHDGNFHLKRRPRPSIGGLRSKQFR